MYEKRVGFYGIGLDANLCETAILTGYSLDVLMKHICDMAATSPPVSPGAIALWLRRMAEAGNPMPWETKHE